jgi:cell division septation protein DedD
VHTNSITQHYTHQHPSIPHTPTPTPSNTAHTQQSPTPSHTKTPSNEIQTSKAGLQQWVISTHLNTPTPTQTPTNTNTPNKLKNQKNNKTSKAKKFMQTVFPTICWFFNLSQLNNYPQLKLRTKNDYHS